VIGFRRLKWGESAFTVGWEVLCDREASIQERGRKEERNKEARLPWWNEILKIWAAPHLDWA
jgi:hypothetical protein